MKLAANRLRLGAAAILTTMAFGAVITPGVVSAGTPSAAPSATNLVNSGGNCTETYTEYQYVKYVKGTFKSKKSNESYSHGSAPFDWTIWPSGSTTWSEQNVAVLTTGPHNDTWEVNHNGHKDEYHSTNYQYRPTGETRAKKRNAECPPFQKVTICHSAGQSGTYTNPTVSYRAIDNGYEIDWNGHGNHANDIIPAFGNFPGQGDTSLLQYPNCERPKPDQPSFPPEVVEQFGACAVGSNTVSGTRTTTSFKAVFNTQTWTWEKVQDGNLEVVDISRPLSEQEQAACKPTYTPLVEKVEDDCAAGDSTVTVTTTTTNYKAVYSGGVWTKVPDGAPVVDVTSRPLNEQEQAACKPTYTPLVEKVEDDCAAGDSTVTVTTTTTNYKAVYSGGVWTKVPDGAPVVDVTSRPLSEQQQADCLPIRDPKVVREDVGEPECGATTIQVKVTTTTFSYTYNEQTKSWDEVGHAIVTYETRDLTEGEHYQCPTYNLSVVCTSAGPEYGAWLVNNNANQDATVDGVLIPPGGSHVFNVVADAVTFGVVWEDGVPAQLSSQGQNDCTYEPPVTTEPPDTTAPPTETTQPPVTTDPTTPTEPPTTPGPSGLSISAIGPVCLRDAPYIEVTFGNQPEFNGRPAAITFIDLDGNSVGTDTATYQAGSTVRFVYPGASVDGAGNPTDWPGWMLVDGHWVVDPSDARLRDGLTVVIEVNPTATATVTYPPATAACANPQTTPDPAPSTTVPAPAGRLPQTGASTGVLAMVAAAFLLAGGGAIFATRRSGASG